MCQCGTRVPVLGSATSHLDIDKPYEVAASKRRQHVVLHSAKEHKGASVRWSRRDKLGAMWGTYMVERTPAGHLNVQVTSHSEHLVSKRRAQVTPLSHQRHA